MELSVIEQALAGGLYRFTDHAQEQMGRRQLAEADVRLALASPDEILPVRAGRVVVHAMLKTYLLRVFIDVEPQPMEVVTAYRTSKIDRYRSQP